MACCVALRNIQSLWPSAFRRCFQLLLLLCVCLYPQNQPARQRHGAVSLLLSLSVFIWSPGSGAVLRTWKYSGADTAHMGSRHFGLTHDHNMLLKMGEVRHGKLTNRDRKENNQRFSTEEDRLIMVRVGELDINNFFSFLQNHLLLIHVLEKHGTKHSLHIVLFFIDFIGQYNIPAF